MNFPTEKQVTVSEMLGKTFIEVTKGHDEIIFKESDKVRYEMYHLSDCCESVYLDDVIGDLQDLVGSPIVMAEEATSHEPLCDQLPEEVEYDGSYTWTFYKFATVKGYVTLRWYGTSNGYYSESVSIIKIKEV